MFLNLKKALFLVGSSALLFSACGDDGGGDGTVTPDAATTIDASVPSIDAMPDTTFAGTVSLAEVAITNPEAAGVGGISGAAAVISFTAPADVNPPDPAFPQPVGACKVTIIDLEAGDVEQGSDGGPVSVTGTLAGDFGCAYNAALDTYLCSTTDAAAAGAMPIGTTLTTVGAPAGGMILTIAGADFSGVSYRGMNIVLAGFPNDAGNGRFQVLADKAANAALTDEQLVLLNSQGLTGATVLAAASAYQTLVGAGPIVGGYDFLDDGTTPVVITKAAATDAPALNSSLTANGSGFALSDTSVKAHEFPVSGSGDATFLCDDGTTDTCGTKAGTLQGIIVFGETTDGVLTTGPLASFAEMPDPVKKFARFQCSGIGQQSITIPSAAVDLINSTGHTRIQTSVTYANAEISGKTNIVVAHGVLGFTTPAATAQ